MVKESKKSITLHVGQAVPWPHSWSGFAQIVELRRKKVRIYYRTKNGCARHALVAASAVARQQLLFELDNPYNRGRVAKSKTFEV